jgi:glycosyltransferase involved in cell wall biosynthesis
VEIIRKYAELVERGEWPFRSRGLRFRWLSEPDKGQADALMKGFSKADGEIFAWINSDDIYLPGTLQFVAEFFRGDSDSALLYGDALYCDTSGKSLGRYPTEDFDFAKLAWFNFFCQPSTFFRKEAFEKVGALDTSLQFAMDYDLFIRLSKSFKVSYSPRTFAKYRLHDDAKTMRIEVLSQNHEESLHVALNHFGWAPLNRVYGCCNCYCLAKAPQFLIRFRLFTIVATLMCALPRTLWLNRGLRRRDLKLLTWRNIHKLFKNRMEILRG